MIHGILLIDKPEGPTSNRVVQSIRRMLKTKKVGHTGTLDPFATGLLVLLCGDATKVARYLNVKDKKYRAFCKWGEATDTGDPTGQVVASTEMPLPSLEKLNEALVHFIGEISQVPPMFSAKKINGQPLYKKARKGVVVKRKPVNIHIHSSRLIERSKTGFHFEVHCSKGTYIRTLAEDICRYMGGQGHLGSLHRTQNGEFSIDQAHTPKELSELADIGKLESAFIPTEVFCERFAAVELVDKAAEKLTFGQVPTPDQLVRWAPFTPENPVRFIDKKGRLLALARPLMDSNEAFLDDQAKKTFKIEYNFCAGKL